MICERHAVPTDDAEAHLCVMCARPTEVDLATICDIDVLIHSKVEGVDWDYWAF